MVASMNKANWSNETNTTLAKIQQNMSQIKMTLVRPHGYFSLYLFHLIINFLRQIRRRKLVIKWNSCRENTGVAELRPS